MWRNIHSWLGLASLGLVLVLSVSGAILATLPLADALQPQVQDLRGISVADVIENVTRANPNIELERIKVLPSSMVAVYGWLNRRNVKLLADVRTGELIGSPQESAFYSWMRSFHRSLFLGFPGRAIAFGTSATMSLMCLSGMFVLVRRMGGWKQIFAPIKGRWFERLHTVTGRLALVPLSVIVVSGTYLSSTTMGFLSSGESTPPAYPESLEELAPVPAYLLSGLQETPLSKVREIGFPIPEDWFDVFTIKTHASYIFFDQFTGEELSEQPFTFTQRLFDLFTLLHTAEGAAPWGIVAGIAVLSVPMFAFTGTIIWLNRLRSGAGRIRNNASAREAETVIIVGSENNSTWGFAKALHEGLVAEGRKVQTRAMNDLRAAYPAAQNLLVLTATFGDGDAPKNAIKFNKRLKDLAKSHIPNFAVLGFGDKSFLNYCKFAEDVHQTLLDTGRQPLLPMTDINRKSAQTFSHWGASLGDALACDLVLDYAPPRPKTHRLVLRGKQVFGTAYQKPIAVLRFEGAERQSAWPWTSWARTSWGRRAGYVPNHMAGDLVAIQPPDGEAARLYSLASNRSERCLEICVARQEGGVCSCFLNALEVGDSIEAFIEPNQDFKLPRRGRRPVVMVGAGTGIAPFVGMIRANKRGVPIDLFWGNRHPKSDFLYQSDIELWLKDNRLQNFYPAFSRVEKPSYVQDRIQAHASHVRARLAARATIMVCGSRAMADGVGEELDKIAAQIGLSVAELKRQGRYLEDTY